MDFARSADVNGVQDIALQDHSGTKNVNNFFLSLRLKIRFQGIAFCKKKTNKKAKSLSLQHFFQVSKEPGVAGGADLENMGGEEAIRSSPLS